MVAHHPQGHPHHDNSWHGEDARLGTPRGSVVLVPVPARPTDERAEQLRRQHANVEPDSQTNGEQHQDIAGTSDGRTAGSRWGCPITRADSAQSACSSSDRRDRRRSLVPAPAGPPPGILPSVGKYLPCARRGVASVCGVKRFSALWAAASPSTSVPSFWAEPEKTDVLAAGWYGCVAAGGVRQRNPRPAAVPFPGRRRKRASRRWMRPPHRWHAAVGSRVASEKACS